MMEEELTESEPEYESSDAEGSDPEISPSIEVNIEDVEDFASDPSFIRKLEKDKRGWESGDESSSGQEEAEGDSEQPQLEGMYSHHPYYMVPSLRVNCHMFVKLIESSCSPGPPTPGQPIY